MESPIDSVRRHFTDFTAIGAIFSAFVSKGCYLQSEFLNDPLNFLLVDLEPSVA